MGLIYWIIFSLRTFIHALTIQIAPCFASSAQSRHFTCKALLIALTASSQRNIFIIAILRAFSHTSIFMKIIVTAGETISFRGAFQARRHTLRTNFDASVGSRWIISSRTFLQTLILIKIVIIQTS